MKGLAARVRRHLPPTLLFFAAWAALDAVASIRYPASEDPLWYLLPQIDVIAVFGLFALFGAARRPVPWPLHAALVTAFLLVRLIRLGDGIADRFLSREMSVAIDLPLVPELARLGLSTLRAGPLAAVCLGLP